MKKGISLLALVITIVVILIIASVVIMTFVNANMLGNGRISKFVSNREAYQNSLKLYINDAETKTFSNYSVEELLYGTDGMNEYKLTDDIDYKTSVNGVSIDVRKINNELLKKNLGMEFKTELGTDNWYMSKNGGLYYIITNTGKIPSWFYVEGEISPQISTFFSTVLN